MDVAARNKAHIRADIVAAARASPPERAPNDAVYASARVRHRRVVDARSTARDVANELRMASTV